MELVIGTLLQSFRKVLVWLVAAAGAVLLLLLMLFYRSEAIYAEKKVQELTQELVLSEEALQTRIQLEAKQNEIMSAGHKAKANTEGKTNAAIETIKREGSRTPLDVHTIEQLRLRSSEVRQAALDNTK